MPQAALAELQSRPASLCEVAAAPDESTILNLDASSGGESGDGGPAVISSGMAMKNFDPVRYSGRWFEVASLKLGFAGQGQGDCHCTQVCPMPSFHCSWTFSDTNVIGTNIPKKYGILEVFLFSESLDVGWLDTMVRNGQSQGQNSFLSCCIGSGLTWTNTADSCHHVA